ncbi:MAG: cell division protein FtsQ/DivIB [Rhodospirillales bacterium]|jgi:cell division protein FtsQ|nr:cell division protein FtsQ/DivIB [Rhodospirillales bacterium]
MTIRWPWRGAGPIGALPPARRLAAVFVAGFAVAAAVAAAQHAITASSEDVRDAAAGVAARAGFAVAEVFVIGRHDTPRADITEAMAVERGTPILALDLGAMRDRLLALPWVREASIERQLPDTLFVQISERRPLAIWQNRGQFAVIDESGEVLSSGNVAGHAHLPLVVGDDAPRHAAALIRMLETEPELAKRVKAAVRVGNRRWDVTLAGNIDVRLPESGAEAAWRRLAAYQRQHRLLDKPVAAIDLRLPDRVGVQRGPGAPQPDTGKRGRDA